MGTQIPKIPSQPMAGHCGVHLSFQLCGEARIGGCSPGLPRHKVRPHLKNNQCNKRTGRVTKVVEGLLSKHTALCSTSQYHQKKKKVNRPQTGKNKHTNYHALVSNAYKHIYIYISL
jgi:hypothetical protein